jgi:hypothetical protein
VVERLPGRAAGVILGVFRKILSSPSPTVGAVSIGCASWPCTRCKPPRGDLGLSISDALEDVRAAIRKHAQGASRHRCTMAKLYVTGETEGAMVGS